MLFVSYFLQVSGIPYINWLRQQGSVLIPIKRAEKVSGISLILVEWANPLLPNTDYKILLLGFLTFLP